MKKGQITVFMSLILTVILALVCASIESARIGMVRNQIERTVDLGEYSMLSEFNKKLLERYDLFYLDTAYGGKLESTTMMRKKLLEYYSYNLSPKKGLLLGNCFEPYQLAVKEIKLSNLSRATDQNGMVYYEQAVAYMKDRAGWNEIQSLLSYDELRQNIQKKERQYQVADQREQTSFEILKRRRQNEEKAVTDNPVDKVDSLKNGSLLTYLVKEPGKLSTMAISLEGVPSNRELAVGEAPQGINPGNLFNDQIFQSYLLEKFSNALDYLSDEEKSSNYLDYQLEYIIAGEESDIKNLESVTAQLLVIREGINYAYLQTDAGKKAEAYALATTAVGATMVPGLVEAAQQVILLAWAYGESVIDVRGLLQGNKVALEKNGSTWKLPLSGLLNLKVQLREYDHMNDETGMTYKEYLRILLMMSSRTGKCMRSLDIVEGVIRMSESNKNFYIDQCIDGFQVETTLFTPKVFLRFPSLEEFWDSKWTNTDFVITRKFAYQW